MKKKTTKRCSTARSVIGNAKLIQMAAIDEPGYFIIAYRRRKRANPMNFYFWYTVFFSSNHLKDTRSEMFTRKAHVLKVAKAKAEWLKCAIYYDAGKPKGLKK